MAGVPTTGGLSLRNIARERYYGDYGGGGSITGPVSMYDLLNGGNAGGGLNYPALNVACGNVTPTGSMNSWRGYCQNWLCYYPTGSSHYSGEIVARVMDACGTSSLSDTYWASAQLTNASTGAGWTVNTTILYNTNAQTCSGGTVSLLTSAVLVIYIGSGATANTYVETNASGVVTSITQC